MLNALYARLDSRGVVSPAARDGTGADASTGGVHSPAGGPSASSVQQVVGSDVGDSDPTPLTWLGKPPAPRQGKGLQVSDDDPTLRAGALRFLRGLDQKAWPARSSTDVTSGDVFDWRPYLSSSPVELPGFGTAIESIFAEARPLGPHVFVARLSDNSWCTIRPYRGHTWVVPGIVLPDGFE